MTPDQAHELRTRLAVVAASVASELDIDPADFDLTLAVRSKVPEMFIDIAVITQRKPD